MLLFSSFMSVLVHASKCLLQEILFRATSVSRFLSHLEKCKGLCTSAQAFTLGWPQFAGQVNMSSACPISTWGGPYERASEERTKLSSNGKNKQKLQKKKSRGPQRHLLQHVRVWIRIRLKWHSTVLCSKQSGPSSSCVIECKLFK